MIVAFTKGGPVDAMLIAPELGVMSSVTQVLAFSHSGDAFPSPLILSAYEHVHMS